MNQKALLALLTDAVSLLQSAEAFKIDIHRQLIDSLRRELPIQFTEYHPHIEVEESAGFKILTKYPNAEEFYIGQNVGKLDAVKAYKNRTGESLMTSKKAIEKAFEEQGVQFKKY